MVNRGEVWWREHPEATRRPFLVLTRDSALSVLTSTLAVPATRTVRGIPTEVALDQSDGMPDACVLTLDNLTVVDISSLTRRITRLNDDRMAEVCHALQVATGC